MKTKRMSYKDRILISFMIYEIQKGADISDIKERYLSVGENKKTQMNLFKRIYSFVTTDDAKIKDEIKKMTDNLKDCMEITNKILS